MSPLISHRSKIAIHPAADPALHQARQILRMSDDERRLEQKLALLRREKRILARQFSDVRGYRVTLAGPQLDRECLAKIEGK